MMGPPVINGMIIHCNWPHKWVTGVVTPIAYKWSYGPPCI